MVRGLTRWPSGYRDFDTIEDMDNTIIDNINLMVEPDDVLYHLGDFTMGGRRDVVKYRNRIHCKTIHLIFGNHDKGARKAASQGLKLFASVSDYEEIKINGQQIILCHYPFTSWNRSHHGSWHLHGHVHGVPMKSDYSHRLDVGVDTNEFRPYSFEDIRDHYLTASK